MDFYIVGIGASAGGFEATWEFFSHIPLDSNMAFVIVQHFKRDVRSLADQLLAKHTPLSVYRAHQMQALQANCIYVIPENRMMILRDGHLILTERSEQEVMNKAIDLFFESLAESAKEKAIGIILSGAGSDGAKGVVAISRAGGIVMVQEPSSAQFDSMPNRAIAQDHPLEILPPDQLATALVSLVQERSSKAR